MVIRSPKIELSDLQMRAVDAIVKWYRDPKAPQVFYLAGFAGTGKSTVYAILVELLGVKRLVTCAYTGKAANVLRQKGVGSAMTVHAAIYAPMRDRATGETYFVVDPEGPAAGADLIGLDECSMIDQIMATDLLSFGKKVLVMGDPGQLPPINGPGVFTSQKPDFFLDEVHRQAADSPIIRLATMARQGQRIELGDYGDGVKVMKLSARSEEEVYRADSQVICGIHRVRHTVTQRIRQRLGFDGEMPLKGERVICVKNDRDRGIFNGSLGTIVSARANHIGARISVDMEDLKDLVRGDCFLHHFMGHFRKVDRPRFQRKTMEFDWSYVLTAHKAQGSEWPHVTVIDDSGSFREDQDKWLYTAITRASQGLTLMKRI